jgi:hypothetical protein
MLANPRGEDEDVEATEGRRQRIGSSCGWRRARPRRRHPARPVQAVETSGTDISSIVTFPGEGGFKEMIVRIRTINAAPALCALQARGFSARQAWRS